MSGGSKQAGRPGPGQLHLALYHRAADWRSVEARLPAEADSLGDLLAQLTGHVSPALLDEANWQPVIAAARHWPATCAALPFGFEFRLRDPQPRADFGLTLLPAGLTADRIRHPDAERAGPTEPADGPLPFATRFARLFAALAAADSALGREIDRVMIEIDIASAALLTGRDPGVFLYFGVGRAGPDHDTGTVLAALNAAAGWDGDPAEFRLAQRFGAAIPPGVGFVSLGAFPGRSRGFRLTATGFADAAAAEAFLRRIGWDGRYDLLAATIGRLNARNAFARLGLMLYARGGELERRLGLYLRQPPAALPATLDGLAAEGCVAEKLAGLHPAAMRPVALWGKAGDYRLLRGLTHIKLVLTEAGLEDIKAYAGLVCA